MSGNHLIEPIVLALSVLASYIGIRRSIKSARDNAKDRATMTYLIERSKEQKFTESVQVIFAINLNDNVDIKKYAKKEHNKDPKADAIRYVVNQYEYLAIGVDHDIFNEDMLIEASKGTTIKLFDALEHYILAIRDETDKHKYQEFEALAKRWRPKSLDKDKAT